MAKKAKKGNVTQMSLTKDQQVLITQEIIGYADAMAHRYMGCGLELDDLKQEARYGVCQAVLHFDATVGVTLKTFATYYIKKYIIKAIEEVGSTIRLKKEDRAIMKILSLDVELSRGASLTPPEGEDDCCYDSPLGELGGAFADEEQDEEQMQKEREETVADLMAVLNSQERKAVSLIFGLEGTELTIRQTAVVLKVQPERVRMIYNKAMAKMEEALLQLPR